MGLDMRPMGKPKPGFEKRYLQIMRIIEGKEEQKLGFLDKLKGKKIHSRDELIAEWHANIIPGYETIGAPRVGRDTEANEWIAEKYEQTEKKGSLEEFIQEHNGYYVIERAKKQEGVPVYISLSEDENVFRGQFMASCEDLIGKDLVAEAWNTKTAVETLDYGKRLLQTANELGKKHNLEHLKDQRQAPDADPESVESKLHVVYSLARWLIFYGENGHGYEAYF